MAIYRSDQSQLTFAAEAAQGGDPELNSGILDGSSPFHAQLTADHPAGSSSLSYDNGTNLTVVVGDFIRISDMNSTTEFVAGTTDYEYEIRRVVFISPTTLASSGTIYLDRPTAFFHKENDYIVEVNNIRNASTVGSGTDLTTGAFPIITRVPGVYESVTVPDLAPSIEPRYYLGTTAKRQPAEFYAGQQTYTGSIGGMVLLNANPLRFPIGKMVSKPSLRQDTSEWTAAEARIDDASGARKGDMFVICDGVSNLTDGDYICFTDHASSTPTGTATSGFTFGDNFEVARVRDIASNTIQLYSPLRFDHADDTYIFEIDFTNTSNTYTHTITPETSLDTIAWHLHMKDSAETGINDFNRRYYGGMVDSASISAEEGGLLTMGWDTVNFMGMLHNQEDQTTVGTNLYSGDSADAASAATFPPSVGGKGMPKYALMDSIESGDVDFPANNPYYFSQGVIKLFGSELARIRSFNLSISNATEPRYYISGRYDRNRGPSEIREGRKSYSMSCTLALPDTVSSTATTYTGATGALEIFKQLILEGNYGEADGMKGFDVELEFIRDTNDSLTISIPQSAANEGLNTQGAFITSAPHNITGEGSALQVDVDMIFRDMKIVIVEPSTAATTTADSLSGAVYP